jgi:hypothetical protein
MVPQITSFSQIGKSSMSISSNTLGAASASGVRERIEQKLYSA